VHLESLTQEFGLLTPESCPEHCGVTSIRPGRSPTSGEMLDGRMKCKTRREPKVGKAEAQTDGKIVGERTLQEAKDIIQCRA
jgi:hypothetical protein